MNFEKKTSRSAANNIYKPWEESNFIKLGKQLQIRSSSSRKLMFIMLFLWDSQESARAQGRRHSWMEVTQAPGGRVSPVLASVHSAAHLASTLHKTTNQWTLRKETIHIPESYIGQDLLAAGMAKNPAPVDRVSPRWVVKQHAAHRASKLNQYTHRSIMACPSKLRN